MKIIPNLYWDINYKNRPTFLQRAWIQRCLELLDPNTSYVYTPPLVNILSLLEEIVNLSERERERTYFFLLSELNMCMKNDPVLLRGEYAISNIVNSLQATANELFDNSGDGCIKANLTDKKKRITRFICDFKQFSAENCKDLFDHFIKNNLYRNLICTLLKKNLLHKKGNNYQIFKELDVLSKNLIIELLTRANYSSSFLRSQFVDIFLKENMKNDFETRLSILLDTLKQSNKNFSVFMRIQGKKIFRNFSTIGEINFQTSFPNMIALIEKISATNNWDAEKERHAKDFFFQGNTTSNLIFAFIDNIEAIDPGNASLQALSKFTSSMNQAKFEYEITNLSIDRRVYAYEKANGNLYFISSKQLRKSRFGTLGNSLRLDNLMSWISWISKTNNSKTSQSEDPKIEEQNKILRQNIIDRITQRALAWHKEALESDINDTIFINHWISLEQIFKPISNIIIKCKKSTADKTVYALANVLADQMKTQIVLDIWGDIKRTGLLGPPRINAVSDGIVEYSNKLLRVEKIDGYYYVPDYNFSRPEFYLLPNLQKYRKKNVYKLQPNSVVFIGDRKSVEKWRWLSGSFIKKNVSIGNNIHLLFEDMLPNVENVLYISFYERHVKTFQSSYLVDFKESYPANLINAMRWFDRLSLHLPFDKVKNFLENPKLHTYTEPLKSLQKNVNEYKKFFDEYEQLLKQGKKLKEKIKYIPHALLFEIFRNQTPKTKNLFNFFKNEKELKTDQSLLSIRVQEVFNLLQEDNDLIFLFFITELDRIRRVRNDIFHNANIPKNFDIIVSRLYKYSRIYLREIIYGISKASTKIPIEKLLFNRFDSIDNF
ncbi:hypothetical protein MHK_006292 [Candidatus Magnetomorum sp. HK-1]|nr:hypothetical protein MHK_006292 [Candidatus Magnetomorum sp. HK-1]